MSGSNTNDDIYNLIIIENQLITNNEQLHLIMWNVEIHCEMYGH